MSKLTAKKIENAAPQEKEYKLHDGGGLFLRVRPSGAKSWLFSFSLPGNSQLIRMTLGSFDNISLKEARAMLPALHKLVAEGIDPRKARAATQTKNTEAITMQALFDAWIEFVKLAGKITSTWIKRHEDRWRLHLKKSLGNILARDITRAHLATALDAMTRKGIKEETRKALTTLNLMLDYALTRHLVEQNPARVLKPKDFAASANRPRSRALSLPELRVLWQTLCDTPTLNVITVTAIKLLILTGCRRKEIASMRWDEIDVATATWSLPAEKTKNRQPHIIYLSPLTLELIENLRPLTAHTEFVFYTEQGKHHIHPDSLSTALGRLRKSSPLSDLSSFSIHDLRRSAATAWAECLKVSPHIIERMLNHQPLNKLIATYQRATYAKEQKETWFLWGEYVKTHVA